LTTATASRGRPPRNGRGCPPAPICRRTPVGYDVVNNSVGTRVQFECSPLSCNSVANEYAVNKHCLVDDFEVAMQLGRLFSGEAVSVEPGRYYVVEVLRRIHPDRRV
jgi:hypothetical protein